MAMKANFLLISALFLVCVPQLSLASDPDMLQDFCVADLNNAVKINGFACKSTVNETDFFYDGLANVGKLDPTLRSVVTTANVLTFPGLNTLGLAMARTDFAPGGLNPPHSHPRASELAFVLEGSIYIGFITTGNKFFSKTLKKGEMFVIPRGLVHFVKNPSKKPASVIGAFNSQLQGTVKVANSLFGSTPAVPDDVLALGFETSTDVVRKIKKAFAPI